MILIIRYIYISSHGIVDMSRINYIIWNDGNAMWLKFCIYIRLHNESFTKKAITTYKIMSGLLYFV